MLKKTFNILITLNLMLVFITPVQGTSHSGTTPMEVLIEIDPADLPMEPQPEEPSEPGKPTVPTDPKPDEPSKPIAPGDKPTNPNRPDIGQDHSVDQIDKPQLENTSNNQNVHDNNLPATGVASYSIQIGLVLMILGFIFITERSENND